MFPTEIFLFYTPKIEKVLPKAYQVAFFLYLPFFVPALTLAARFGSTEIYYVTHYEATVALEIVGQINSL